MLERKGRGFEIRGGSGWGSYDDVGRICEEGPLYRIGNFLRQVDGSNIFRSECREGLDRLGDLLGQFTGRDEDQSRYALGGGDRLWGLTVS